MEGPLDRGGRVVRRQGNEGEGNKMDPEKAAKNTWTGKRAAEAGFPEVEDVDDKSKPGNTIVIFGPGK